MSDTPDIIERLQYTKELFEDHQRAAKDDIQAGIREIERLRAIVERVAKLAKDNQWVVPGDRVWIKTENGPRWFKLTDSFTVPLSIPVHNPDCWRCGWRELTVEECYSTEEAAR